MDKRRRHVPLRAALWRRGMTQRELAEALGVSESLVSMYMSGKKPLGLDRRLEIAQILEADLQSLGLT
jgi:transcriptional regulator with XRE-family HTH domain